MGKLLGLGALLLLMVYLAATCHAQSVAQSTTICHHCPSPKDMNLQFGPEYEPPPQKIFTKAFIAAETFHALAISTDAFITLKRENPRTCLEGNNGFPEFVHGKELAAEGAVEFGFGLGMGMLLHHTKPPRAFAWLPFMAPVYGTTIHIVAATRWYRNCH